MAEDAAYRHLDSGIDCYGLKVHLNQIRKDLIELFGWTDVIKPMYKSVDQKDLDQTILTLEEKIKQASESDGKCYS
jgi:hypothetical protein